MKKIISLFICIVSIFSFAVSYDKITVKHDNDIANVENKIGKSFTIYNDLLLADSNDMYDIMKNVSKNLNVNIFRQTVNSNKKGKLRASKYVLINSKTNFFKYLKIDKAKNFTEKLNKDEYISTQNSNNKNQVGVIKNFVNKDVYIGNLKKLYDSTPVQGTYFVELKKGVSYNKFLNELANKINQRYKKELEKGKGKYTADDFTSNSSGYTNLGSYNNNIFIFSLMASIILIILMCYYVLNNSKKISIYKLLGVSNFKIWLKVFQINLSGIFLAITCVLVVVSFILRGDLDFILYIVKYQLLYYILLTVLSIIPYLIILSTSTNYNLKNKQNKRVVFIVNNVLKIILTTFAILLGASFIGNYNLMHKKLNEIGGWRDAKSYGVFYPLYIGNDKTEKKLNQSYVMISDEFYRIINKKGALLINSKEFEDRFIEKNGKYNGPSKKDIRIIGVNPNYLNRYHVRGLSDRPVKISESEGDIILLVPQKFKNKKDVILNYVKKERKGQFEFEKEEFSGRVRSDVENQGIKIIWTKNYQELFSFNPEVNKSDNNYLKDSIVEVHTLNNSVDSDFWGILGSGGTDPIKIKLVNNDPKLTYERLKPYLIQLHLDDNLKYLVKSNENQMWYELNVDENINRVYISFFICIVCYLIIMMQSVVITFDKYKKKIIIRRLFGLRNNRSYKEHILLFIINWIVQILILLSFTIYYRGLDLDHVKMAVLLVVVEFVLTSLSIFRLENKNKTSVIKGE